MSEKLERLLKLRGSLELYGEDCLRVLDKRGKLVPFRMNASQRFLHAALEKQRAEKGYVRALILKGRRQGCCHAPWTKVLTSTYEWKTLADVRVGDRLLAFDEDGAGRTANDRLRSRRFRTSVVEHVERLQKPRVRLTLSNGAVLTTTPEHRYLSKQRGGCLVQWRHVRDCKLGDDLRIVTAPPAETSPDRGWLAGIFDGEGSIRRNGTVRLSFVQRPGAILERGREILRALGIEPSEVIDDRPAGLSSKLGNNPVHRLDVHRQSDVLRTLTCCPTTRFREEGLFDDHELPGKRSATGTIWAKIEKIEYLPEGDVIDLQTSTKTYVAEGIASHNSTYVAARFYQRVTMNKGRSAYILSHEQASSDALFDIVSRFQTNNPIAPHIGTSNIKELVFDKLDSGYAVATAGQKAGGRGRAIMLFHGSEASRWPNARDHFSSSIQAVPLVVGTEILLETTSAGPSGEFYKKYQEAEAGLGDYIAVFLPWYIEEDNTRPPGPDFELSKEEVDNYMSEVEMAEMFSLSFAQMAFRRSKIQELGSLEAFMQEYPSTAAEAWTDATGIESLIPPILIQRARKAKRPESGPLIFGVDPAGGGGDRFAVAARRGLSVPWVQHRNKIDTLEGTEWVRSLIDEHNPARVNIDAGSIGAAIITNLKSLGPKYLDVVRAVNFGGTSQAKLARPKAPGPRLRRDEMWVRMKQWLELEEGVSIPDDDALASDMAGPRLKPQLTNDTKLEGKAEMRTRGVRSPDLGDAVALTFASNEHFTQYQDATLRPVFANVDTPQEFAYYEGDVAASSTSWMG